MLHLWLGSRLWLRSDPWPGSSICHRGGKNGAVVVPDAWSLGAMCLVLNIRTSSKPGAAFQGENICYERRVIRGGCLCCDDPVGA